MQDLIVKKMTSFISERWGSMICGTQYEMRKFAGEVPRFSCARCSAAATKRRCRTRGHKGFSPQRLIGYGRTYSENLLAHGKVAATDLPRRHAALSATGLGGGIYVLRLFILAREDAAKLQKETSEMFRRAEQSGVCLRKAGFKNAHTQISVREQNAPRSPIYV